MGNINRKLLTKIPLEKALKPFDGASVMLNRFWIIEDECILFYNKYSAQCNSDSTIAESIRKRIYPDARILFLPVVYVEGRFE